MNYDLQINQSKARGGGWWSRRLLMEEWCPAQKMWTQRSWRARRTASQQTCVRCVVIIKNKQSPPKNFKMRKKWYKCRWYRCLNYTFNITTFTQKPLKTTVNYNKSVSWNTKCKHQVALWAWLIWKKQEGWSLWLLN